MFKPMVEVHNIEGILVAEFWDCLRLVPGPVQDLQKHYEEHIRSKGCPDLVVDLLGVTIAGSAALGHFVALQRATRQHGGRIVFCNVDPHVLESFRVSRLVSLFSFCADRAAAVALVRQRGGDETKPSSPPPPDSQSPA